MGKSSIVGPNTTIKFEEPFEAMIAEVNEEWFADAETKDMFFKRLEILKQAVR